MAAKVSVTIDRLHFSDGSSVELDQNDIVVFAGPNNAGKSAALKEIENGIGNVSGKVIRKTDFTKHGTIADLTAFIASRSAVINQEPNITYSGMGFSVSKGLLPHLWSVDLSHLKPLFVARLPTESRIVQSNSTNAIDTLHQQPSNPIHLLASDDQLELRISGYFRRAFGKDLIVYRGGGSSLPLLVGERLLPETGEDRISTSYLKRLLAACVPLQEQGDGMRSFASIILYLLAVDNASILMLDEPEAFLHPPQARLLGEFIARERPANTQLFVSTHSPDVLLGLLNAAPENLRLIRLQRQGHVNRAKELDKVKAKSIGRDPLMKYSGVISGVFHHRVIVVESDADAMFYGALLDLTEVHGAVAPDVLFVQAGGKHRMHALADALRSLDVHVDIIVDIDILNDENQLEKLITSLGGDWALAKQWATPLKKDIEQHKPWLNSGEVANHIRKVLEEAPATGQFPKDIKARIDGVFRKASPWDALKEAGEAAIPAGEASQRWASLKEYCGSLGLWIVPVGELENFCKVVGGHGPKWTRKVIESYDLAIAPELHDAREFVRQIWLRLPLAQT